MKGWKLEKIRLGRERGVSWNHGSKGEIADFEASEGVLHK